MNIRLFFFFKDILDKFILPVGVGTVTIPKKMYGEDFDLFQFDFIFVQNMYCGEEAFP